VTDSEEPPTAVAMPGDVASPPTATASISEDLQGGPSQPGIVLRILRRASGQVMLLSRVRTTTHLPINSDGYIEILRSSGRTWVLDLNYFSGGSRILGKVESACAPVIDFISQQVALATTCVPTGGLQLVAMSTEGRRLWDATWPPTEVWPKLVISQDGSRLAWETLTDSHPIDAFAPLDFDYVKGQLVEVYDAVDGKQVLKAPASPVLDGGGNVAISPSGKRVAVLDGGAIQVYELSAPAAAPLPSQSQTAH